MTEERSETLSLVAEAVEAGCRLERACNELGLDVRTVQRWRAQPAGGLDARRGPRTQPRQKLSAKERAKVLDIADAPEFRSLSPKQIVPRLAEAVAIISTWRLHYNGVRPHSSLGYLTPNELKKTSTQTRPEARPTSK